MNQDTICDPQGAHCLDREPEINKNHKNDSERLKALTKYVIRGWKEGEIKY